MRVIAAGSHDTGKTSLARRISQRYKLTLLAETAREVVGRMELSVDSLRSDLELVNDVQRKIFERQVELERAAGDGYVSDRAFDNIAYAAEHSEVTADLVRLPAFAEQVERMRNSIVFFVRPHPLVGGVDGVREQRDWDGMQRIDGMIKLLLEMHRIPYVPVNTPSAQERWRIVEGVLDAYGAVRR